MIRAEDIKFNEQEEEHKRIVSLHVGDKYFTLTRDMIKYEYECGDHDTIDFEVWQSEGEEKFSEDEKQDILNLLHNGDLDEYLED